MGNRQMNETEHYKQPSQAASNQICLLGSSMTKAMSCEVPDTLEPLRLVIT